MEDFQNKPKRKREGRNPYLFLGAGIAIGITIAAILMAVLLFLGQRQSADIALAPTQVPFATPSPVGFVPTEAPSLNAQGIQVQATVIAPRVQAAAVSPNGRYLATTATDEGHAKIILHELRVERNLYGDQTVLYETDAYFDDLLFSPDGSKLVATINYGIALLFDVETKALLGEYPNIGGAAFNADGSLLALVGANNGIRLIDTETLTLLDSTEHDAYQVGAVSISSKNQLAIALDNHIEVYALANLALAPQIYEVNSSFAYDLAFHPSGDYLAVSGDGFVLVLDLESNSRTQYNFSTPSIRALAFSPSGDWLAVAGGEAGYGEAFLTVFRWNESDIIPPDPAYYRPITLTGHEHSIMDVAFTPDDYLLSAAWDGSVRLWDLTTHEEISRLQL
jgi:WD40 repeat protein